MKARIIEPVRMKDAIRVGKLVEQLQKFGEHQLVVMNQDNCCLDVLEVDVEESFNCPSERVLYTRGARILFG